MRIYIKGFKSISNGQYVALGKKLTFLVGPNSAGKSVVMHAIEKLQGNSPRFEHEDELVHYNIFHDRKAVEQSLGIEWEDGGEVIEYRTTLFDGDWYSGDGNEILGIYGHELNFQPFDAEVGKGKYCLVRRMISGVSVTESVFDASELGVSRDYRKANQSPRDYPWNVEVIVFDPLHSNRKEIKSIYDWIDDLLGHESIPESFSSWRQDLRKKYDSGVIFWEPLDIIWMIKNCFKGADRQHNLNQFGRFDAIFRRLLKGVDRRFMAGYPGAEFDLILVSADRVLPTNNDVETVLGDKVIPSNIYHDLMRSLVAEEWGIDLLDGDQESGQREGSTIIQSAQDAVRLASSVNRALLENLFLDNGYQVKVESTLRISKFLLEKGFYLDDHGNGLSGGRISDVLFDAKMYLVDVHGRRLQFSEVGSGIGYVLPVLIECFKPRNSGKIVFVQQPELHLHPALQASLCDVLIEAAKDKMIVSETHSEHLILRALKRIRQTYNGTLLDEELRLNPEDVAINYFEPMPDGSTRVHIMRVAPDGEFIDRWTNGFFPERDQELFDE
jgi:hypothetical protein